MREGSVNKLRHGGYIASSLQQLKTDHLAHKLPTYGYVCTGKDS